MNTPETNTFEISVAFFDKAISKVVGIDRKGKTTPYTSINGHMSSFVSKEGTVGLRLSAQDRDNFIVKHKTNLIIQHGVVMKEFVEVPLKVLKNTDVFVGYLMTSHAYCNSLKPAKKGK